MLLNNLMDIEVRKRQTASVSKPLQDNIDRSKKYDRQLRLWGDHGQTALEGSRVCIVNVSTLGAEILKSLVLAGIGSFTVVDDQIVTGQDIDTNFFVDEPSLGASRAETVTRLIREINPDVHGEFVNTNLQTLLKECPNFFHQFSIVIAANIAEAVNITRFALTTWILNVPLIVCQSIGFFGFIRVQVQEHTVVETHAEQVFDLRIDQPFPELVAYTNAINMELMTPKQHSQVPYPVLLLQQLQEWRMKYSEDVPGPGLQLETFHTLLKRKIRKNDFGVPFEEENFEEALKVTRHSISPTIIPQHVFNIFNDRKCTTLTPMSEPFWIMAKAVAIFVQNTQMLPLEGSIPDMTSDTLGYVQLKQIYASRANHDADIVYSQVQKLLAELGLESNTISKQEVETFCKHVRNLHLVRGTSISDEYTNKKAFRRNVGEHLKNPQSMLHYYLLFRGVRRFQSEHRVFPGEEDRLTDVDAENLKTCIKELLQESSLEPVVIESHIQEMCRYGGAELSSVSAFIGGCVAQEAVKLITHQYKPLNNTLIYDGKTGETATFIL